MNTYIPTSCSFDAGYKTSIGKLLELEDCIIVGDFNAHSFLWHSKLPEDTRSNNIASAIDLSNHVVLNEKASTRVTDSCKSSADISVASSSLAMNIDCRTEYALGSGRLQIVQSINCELVTHTAQRTFINFRKADLATFKDAFELKL